MRNVTGSTEPMIKKKSPNLTHKWHISRHRWLLLFAAFKKYIVIKSAYQEDTVTVKTSTCGLKMRPRFLFAEVKLKDIFR